MIAAIAMIAAGAYILFTARVWIHMNQRTQARRIEDRLERGEDAYDGELQALQTHSPARVARLIRLCGAAILVAGSADLIYIRVS